jgi:hypothetical protein
MQLKGLVLEDNPAFPGVFVLYFGPGDRNQGFYSERIFRLSMMFYIAKLNVPKF